VSKFPNRAPGAIDATGQTFANWIALSRAGSYGKSATWHCRCLVCGDVQILTRVALKRARKRGQTGCGKCGKTARKAVAA
jgi:hypothetical protein